MEAMEQTFRCRTAKAFLACSGVAKRTSLIQYAKLCKVLCIAENQAELSLTHKTNWDLSASSAPTLAPSTWRGGRWRAPNKPLYFDLTFWNAEFPCSTHFVGHLFSTPLHAVLAVYCISTLSKWKTKASLCSRNLDFNSLISLNSSGVHLRGHGPLSAALSGWWASAIGLKALSKSSREIFRLRAAKSGSVEVWYTGRQVTGRTQNEPKSATIADHNKDPLLGFLLRFLQSSDVQSSQGLLCLVLTQAIFNMIDAQILGQCDHVLGFRLIGLTASRGRRVLSNRFATIFPSKTLSHVINLSGGSQHLGIRTLSSSVKAKCLWPSSFASSTTAANSVSSHSSSSVWNGVGQPKSRPSNGSLFEQIRSRAVWCTKGKSFGPRFQKTSIKGCINHWS